MLTVFLLYVTPFDQLRPVSLLPESFNQSLKVPFILTGYTEVDSITDSINKGHIYKFLLKPWNDQNLKVEINKAIEQYELIQSNKKLHEKIVEKNRELNEINNNLEIIVEQRTSEIQIQHQALELSRGILEDLPLPIIGVSTEGIIVLTNGQVQSLLNGKGFALGMNISDYFSDIVLEKVNEALENNTRKAVTGYQVSGETWDIDLIPLSGKFHGKGIIMTVNLEKEHVP